LYFAEERVTFTASLNEQRESNILARFDQKFHLEGLAGLHSHFEAMTATARNLDDSERARDEVLNVAG
jgi:hypothetical protein